MPKYLLFEDNLFYLLICHIKKGMPIQHPLSNKRQTELLFRKHIDGKVNLFNLIGNCVSIHC